MNKIESVCPNPADIEPLCFSLDTERALAHAQSFVDKLGLKDGIRPAIGLIIPSKSNGDQILYGLRDPLYSGEFPNAWGLPSTNITVEIFRNLTTQNGELNIQGVTEAINIVTNAKQKLPNISLVPERIVGWMGRLRLERDGYNGDYYLIMVDIRTTPIRPEAIPNSSIAYSEFTWLTPGDYMRSVEENPNRACGACSALAYQDSLR